MKLTGFYEIKLDKNSVWKALNNPEILKKCIPGCIAFKKNSDKSFTATSTNKIGPFNATFTGDIELKDLNPPDSYKIVGNGNSPVGFASGEAKVKLEENNGITKLIYIVEVNVGGKIAQVGSRLIDMTAKKMADIFFSNFSDSISLPNKKEDKVSRSSEQKLELDQTKDLKLKKINKKILFTLTLTIIVVLLAIYLIK